MMQTSVASAATRRVEQIAQEYRDKGYEVLVEARAPQLPEPLARYRPDLVVRKGDEVVVIEVKSREISGDPQLQELAEVVRRQPGWRIRTRSHQTGAWTAGDEGMERGGYRAQPRASGDTAKVRSSGGGTSPGVVCG